VQRLLKSLEGEGADEIIVVVNGAEVAPDALAALRDDQGVRVLEFGDIGVIRARYEGTCAATGSLIQYIDDDDEFFPGALASRRQELRDKGGLMVVSDGVLDRGGAARPFPSGGVARITDPPLAILQESWNGTAACAMYRREAVSPERMLALPVMEWTVLGYLIAQQPNAVRFVAESHYRINDTPGSLSKQDWYCRGEVEALNTILRVTQRADLRREIYRKISAAQHDFARAELANGRLIASWRLHLASLARPGGLRYLRFTARLLAPRKADLPPPNPTAPQPENW